MSLNCACSVYLDLPEDEPIPDTVSPHDTFHHLCLLPPECKAQHPALQRAVGLPKDLQRHTPMLLIVRNTIVLNLKC